MAITRRNPAFGNDAKDKMMEGVSIINRVVSSTLGPNGQVVIIERDYGDPQTTKDGVTVAKYVDLVDPEMNMGCKLVQAAARKSAMEAGDGTTTTTVITAATALTAHNYVKNGSRSSMVRRGIDKACVIAVNTVKEMAKDVATDEDVLNVATISANGESVMGQTILNCHKEVGKNSVISIERGIHVDDRATITTGYWFDRGYYNPAFVDGHTKGKIVYNEPVFLLVDKDLASMNELFPLLEIVSKEGLALVIVAENFGDDLLELMLVNYTRGTIKSVLITAPQFGRMRSEELTDMSVVLGCRTYKSGDVITADNAHEFLGRSVKVEVSRERTVITGGVGSKVDTENRVDVIKSQMNDDATKFQTEIMKQRISKLSGGIAVIHVGGKTVTELGERFDRYEDAVLATQSALEEGYVAGGGTVLLRAAVAIEEAVKSEPNREIADGMLALAAGCVAPLKGIVSNIGESPDIVLSKVRESEGDMGYDAVNMEMVNMVEAGIIDPAKVTRCAIENAASTAGLLTTTGCTLTLVHGTDAMLPQM